MSSFEPPARFKMTIFSPDAIQAHRPLFCLVKFDQRSWYPAGSALWFHLGFSHLSKSFLHPSHFSRIAHSLTFQIVTFLVSLEYYLSASLLQSWNMNFWECWFISPYTSQGIYIHRSWRAILKSKCDIFVKFRRKKIRHLFSSLSASPPLWTWSWEHSWLLFAVSPQP